MKTFNLLPEEKKGNIKKAYRMRVFVLLLIMLSISGAVSLIFMLPSFLAASIRYSEISLNKENLEKDTPELLEIENLKSSLEEIKNKMKALKAEDRVLFSETIRQIVDSKSSGISLRSFSYNVKEEQIDLRITGVANDRDNLTSFVKNLNEGGTFSDANLPVSDLAGDSNISFSMTLVIKFDEEIK